MGPGSKTFVSSSELQRSAMIKTLLVGLMFIFVGCDQNQLNQPQGAYSDLASAEKDSCFYNIDSTGNLISWAPDQRIVFYFENDVPEEMKSAIKDAAAKWTSTSGENLIQISPKTVDSSTTKLDYKNIIYWIKDSSYFNTKEQGRTFTRWKRAKITDSDILINATAFQFFLQAPAAGSKIHLGSLLVHEFGHALGLRHIPFPQSLMFPSLDYLQVRTTLSSIDSKTLRCEYP